MREVSAMSDREFGRDVFIELVDMLGRTAFHDISIQVGFDGGVEVGMHDHSWEQVLQVARAMGVADELDDLANYDGVVVVSFAHDAHRMEGVTLKWFTKWAVVEKIGELADLLKYAASDDELASDDD